jgi:hypothetical protein
MNPSWCPNAHLPLTTVRPPQNQKERFVDFGLVDEKGRRIGAKLTTYELDFVANDNNPGATYDVAPGHYYILTPQHTRNGEEYGFGAHIGFFQRPHDREFAALKYLDDAKSRAAAKLVRRSARLARRARTSAATKAAEKRERAATKEAQLATKLQAMEAEVQALLDDERLMAYLQASPWPYVIPGPPSMAYTAYEHIVAKNTKTFNYSKLPSDKIEVLRYMRQALNDQVRRQAKGLLPGITKLPPGMP